MKFEEIKKKKWLKMKHKNIRSFEDGRYYYVSFSIKKRKFSKMFVTKEWRNKSDALEAAHNWRDNMKCAVKFALENGYILKV